MRSDEPTTKARSSADSDAIEVPSHKALPSPARSAGSTTRRRVSMFSLPRPRTSCASRCSSSTVLCSEPSAAMDAPPFSVLICFRPLATYSSAVVQSTGFHSPPCLSIGVVRRSSLFSASYEKRSRSAIQHSLTASFSSGTTRSTSLFLTWTIRLAPVESCGLTLLRRDSSQVRAL